MVVPATSTSTSRHPNKNNNNNKRSHHTSFWASTEQQLLVASLDSPKLPLSAWTERTRSA
ncbi:hypothetical protein EON64_09355 [archaeon]|nr:MAG: hypothetical protein EON64_09355 [archaeon]